MVAQTSPLPNRIAIKVTGRYEEDVASGALSPGMLIMKDSNGQVLPHNIRGGGNEKCFAIEDALQGKGISDAFVTGDHVFQVGDVVPNYLGLPGDEFNIILHAGETVVTGDPLISGGDGTLVKEFSAYLANVVADSTAVTNTTVETTFSNGSVSIPAGTLQVGDTIRITGSVFVVNQNSTDTLNVKIYIGTTVIVASGAIDVATSDVATFDITLTVRTIGASGTLVGVGSTTIGTPGTATAKPFASAAAISLDTTVAEVVKVTATWSVANANDQAVLRQFIVTKSGALALSGGGGGSVVARAKYALDLSASANPGFLVARVA